MIYKEILIEALARANLVPRKRAVPSDMLESASRLLNGMIQKYNFSNFISFTRRSIDIDIDSTDIILEDEPDITSITNIKVEDMALRFVAYESLGIDNDVYVYSWLYDSEGKIHLYFKDELVNKKATVYCNTKLKYDIDDEIKIPEIYIELFTTALTYKLAVTYPRTDGNQVAILKSELDEVEKTVKSMISSNKILTRASNPASIISGSFIFGG